MKLVLEETFLNLRFEIGDHGSGIVVYYLRYLQYTGLAIPCGFSSDWKYLENSWTHNCCRATISDVGATLWEGVAFCRKRRCA
jgi:hypothetical protein